MQSYFKYKKHPGDLLRDTSVQELPDIHKNKEDFWVWFHPNYMNSETVAYLNDLYKWLDDELDENEEREFQEFYGTMTKEEIRHEIELTETELTLESLENFYELIRTQKVEIHKSV